MAMVLLVAGGLLIRSFALVTSVEPGFDPERYRSRGFVSAISILEAAAMDGLFKRLAGAPPSQPGLQDSAVAAPLPMDRQGQATFAFGIVGDPPLPPNQSHYRRLLDGESLLFSGDANSAAAGPIFFRAGCAVQSERRHH